MNETYNMHHTNLRWQLLATVSAAALLACAYGAGEAQAASNDSDRPPLWIELGGQLESLGNAQEEFSPAFLSDISQYGIRSPLDVETPPRFGLETEGAISFQPRGSDWVFSAAIRYGRSSRNKNSHQQTPNKPFDIHVPTLALYGYHSNPIKYPSEHVKFADAAGKESEHHLILDFQAGKDVGLGMFGARGSSILSAGVRIAQFSSKSNVSMRLLPDVQYDTKPISSVPAFISFFTRSRQIHNYAASINDKQSFQGMGPSVVWNASAPFAGNSGNGEFDLDWGVNAAVLFGRQKARGHHQTTTRSYYQHYWHTAVYRTPIRYGNYNTISTAHHTNAIPHARMRSVVVPNLGGFAGISYRYADAKISLGYRADFFFGAMDGGIDTRKSENRAFYGPYASISIGIGD